ncbi:MAG TPA: Flp family type IVb pilin [Chloroflexota bacterium]|jgi:Flp pilus assembly pilin Flp|nr:Flp family type IVb pilin [Chloroflexota bacterium]
MWTVLLKMWLRVVFGLGAVRDRLAVLERGAAATEYAIVVTVVALAAIAAVTAFGATLVHVWSSMSGKLGGVG